MKKIVTLMLFAVALLFNSQGISAQNTKEINAMASDKAKEIRKNIKVNDAQMEEVYQAYKDFHTAYSKISDNLDANQERLEKINRTLDERLKGILTPDQYDKYLEMYRTY
ncbi:MAG: hypothetical protein HRU26_01580 [Psychroserpens sp.]|nr:hypothetical protein [Psychroserpens sp.]